MATSMQRRHDLRMLPHLHFAPPPSSQLRRGSLLLPTCCSPPDFHVLTFPNHLHTAIGKIASYTFLWRFPLQFTDATSAWSLPCIYSVGTHLYEVT
jgi:hypothetical protein